MGNELTNSFGSVNTGLDQLYFIAVQQTDPTQKTTSVKDSSSVSDAKPDVEKGVYTAKTTRPQLDKPISNFDPLAFNSILNILQNFPEQILMTTNTLPTAPEDKFPDAMEAEIDALGESKLAEIGNGNPAKGKQILRYAVLHNNAELPPELKEIATGILQKATLKAGNGPNEAFVALEEKTITTQMDLKFQSSVILAKLSDKEQAQVYFAYFIPESADTLPPSLKKLLNEAKNDALASVEKDYGILGDFWKPSPDKEGFLKQMGSDVSTSVEAKIAELGEKNGLSRGQINELKTIFYTGSSNTPNSSTLKPLLDGILKNVTSSAQAKFGFPDGFAVPIDSSAFNAVLNGTFASEFTKLLNGQSLSSADKLSLKNALFSKEAQTALSPDLKATFDKVQALAIVKLGQTHGVPATWVPDTELLAIGAAKMNSAGGKLALTQINQGKEWASSGLKLLITLNSETKAAGGTPSPGHSMLMDYLKAVNSVLIKMTEMLYEISMTDSNLATIMNKIQNDSEIGRLKKQQSDMKDVAAKEKKAESMGPLKAIFMWIVNLILIFFLGPLAFVVIAAMTAKSIIDSVKEGKNLVKAFMAADVITEMTKTMDQIGKAIGGPFGNFFSHAMAALSLVALAVICPMAVAADLMMGEGVFVKELCKAFNIPKDVADKVTMAVQIIAQVVAMIVMAVLSAGATLEISILQITKTITEIALSVVKTVMSLATNFVKTISQMATVIAAKIVEFFADAVKQVVNILKSGVEALGANSSKLEAAEQFLSKAGTFAKEAQAELKAITDGAKDAGKLEKYLKGVIENTVDSIKTAEEQTAKVQKFTDTFKKAQQAQAEAQKTFDSAIEGTTKAAAKTELDTATKATKNAHTAMEDAIAAMKKDALNALSKMEYITITAQSVKDVSDAVVSIHNNILEAQIIRMKAAIEEAKVLIEVFVKMMKEMVAKLMAMAKGAISDVKETGDQIQKMFAEASSVIENLCNARA